MAQTFDGGAAKRALNARFAAVRDAIGAHVLAQVDERIEQSNSRLAAQIASFADSMDNLNTKFAEDVMGLQQADGQHAERITTVLENQSNLIEALNTFVEGIGTPAAPADDTAEDAPEDGAVLDDDAPVSDADMSALFGAAPSSGVGPMDDALALLVADLVGEHAATATIVEIMASAQMVLDDGQTVPVFSAGLMERARDEASASKRQFENEARADLGMPDVEAEEPEFAEAV